MSYTGIVFIDEKLLELYSKQIDLETKLRMLDDEDLEDPEKLTEEHRKVIQSQNTLLRIADSRALRFNFGSGL